MQYIYFFCPHLTTCDASSIVRGICNYVYYALIIIKLINKSITLKNSQYIYILAIIVN